MRPVLPGAFFTIFCAIMEGVMRMKKALIIFLVLLLLAGGLFFWKGGHHAIVVADILEEWLDADAADQSLTVLVQMPGSILNEDTGRIEPHIRQLRLSGDTFWTEYADRPLFGLTVQGATAYTDGKTLYMDTGKSYTLPELTGLRKYARQLSVGLLLHGRLTKNQDTYHIAMEAKDMKLHVDITANPALRLITVIAVLPDDTAVTVSMTPLPTAPHPIGQPVLDAMVRTKMEPPMPLTEPLELLVPALENLIPLQGDLTLGVESGILKLSESLLLRMDDNKAELERKNTIVSIDLPMAPADLEPLPAALLLLRHGEFLLDGTNAQIKVNLPAEITGAICTALVPQMENLGMTFGESTAMFRISSGAIQNVTLSADGEVPFLVTTIPLSFRAELHIQ